MTGVGCTAADALLDEPIKCVDVADGIKVTQPAVQIEINFLTSLKTFEVVANVGVGGVREDTCDDDGNGGNAPVLWQEGKGACVGSVGTCSNSAATTEATCVGGTYTPTAIFLGAPAFIYLPELVTAQQITVKGLTQLESMVLPQLSSIAGVKGQLAAMQKGLEVDDCPKLDNLDLPSLVSLGSADAVKYASVTGNAKLTALTMPWLSYMSADARISDNDVLGALAFPRLKTVGGVGAVAVDVDKAGFFISGNAKLTKIDLPLLEVSGPIDPTTGAPVVSEDAGPREDPPITITLNPLLDSLSAPVLGTVTGTLTVQDNIKLKTVNLAGLKTVFQSVKFECTAGTDCEMTGLSLPSLAAVGGYTAGSYCDKYGAPAAETLCDKHGTVSISGMAKLTSVLLNALTAVEGFTLIANAVLESVSLPALARATPVTLPLAPGDTVQTAIKVSDNARLATFSATALVTVGGALEVERNSKLAALDLPALTKVTKGFSLKYNTAMVAFTAPKLTHIGTADTHNLVVQSTEGANEDAGAKFIVASCPKKPDGVNCAEASAAGTGGLIPGETYKILAGTGFKETFSIYVDAALPLQPNSKYKIVSGTGYTDVNGATFGCAPVSATCTAATTTSLGNYQPGTGKPTNDNVGTLFETGAVVPFQPTCARSADLGGCVQMLVEVTNDDYGTTFVAPARISDPATEGAVAGWNAGLTNAGQVQRQSKLASLTFPALKAVTGDIIIKDNTALARAEFNKLSSIKSTDVPDELRNNAVTSGGEFEVGKTYVVLAGADRAILEVIGAATPVEVGDKFTATGAGCGAHERLMPAHWVDADRAYQRTRDIECRESLGLCTNTMPGATLANEVLSRAACEATSGTCAIDPTNVDTPLKLGTKYKIVSGTGYNAAFSAAYMDANADEVAPGDDFGGTVFTVGTTTVPTVAAPVGGLTMLVVEYKAANDKMTAAECTEVNGGFSTEADYTGWFTSCTDGTCTRTTTAATASPFVLASHLYSTNYRLSFAGFAECDVDGAELALDGDLCDEVVNNIAPCVRNAPNGGTAPEATVQTQKQCEDSAGSCTKVVVTPAKNTGDGGACVGAAPGGGARVGNEKYRCARSSCNGVFVTDATYQPAENTIETCSSAQLATDATGDRYLFDRLPAPYCPLRTAAGTTGGAKLANGYMSELARALGVDVSNFAVKGEGLIYHQDA